MNVVIADDHSLFRDGLRSLLRTTDDVDVVATVGNGSAAVQAMTEHHADALVLDVEMPGQPVFTTIAQVRGQHPSARIVVLSMHEDVALQEELVARGADAFMPKSASVDAVAESLRGRHEHDTTSGVNSQAPLSEREREVLALVAQALTNREVAAMLHVAPGTVKRHLANISDKLSAVSRLDAVRKAQTMGLL